MSEIERPCFLLKPSLTYDGKRWCALFGPDIKTGVHGYGNSPAEAYYDFDKNWFMEINYRNRHETYIICRSIEDASIWHLARLSQGDNKSPLLVSYEMYQMESWSEFAELKACVSGRAVKVYKISTSHNGWEEAKDLEFSV